MNTLMGKAKDQLDCTFMTIVSNQPHVVVVPYPAQGHVMPLMKLSCHLADRGFTITFVNTEDIHARLRSALLSENSNKTDLDRIHMVALPDGLTPDERKDPSAIDYAITNKLPAELEKLLFEINKSSENGKIACLIADETLGWALDVASKMGIRRASFFPASAGVKALTLHVPKMIERGEIDENGNPTKNNTIVWSPAMPAIKTDHLVWNCMGGLISSEIIFHSMTKSNKSSKSAEWAFCNTFDELEHTAIGLVPNLLPIGPLLVRNQLGNFWPEDLTCISWLDQQVTNSVIYVAFGSIAIFNQQQFDEIAFGLELLAKPFIWVVKSDIFGRPATTFPEGFEERVAHVGKIVSWAPQQKVLDHPAVACFVTHCGWNSIIEGVSMGVPFICWPYFADQFFNESLVTDVWKVGLGLNSNEHGITTRDEMSNKVNQLLADKEIKNNSLKLKERALISVGNAGSSSKNLELFMEELKK